MKTSGINGFGVGEGQQAGQAGQTGLAQTTVWRVGKGPAGSHLSHLPS